RRRHTRFSRDWSSDVCSSDLGTMPRCRSTVSDLRFPQLFLIVAGILIQLRVILHILALTEIFLEAPRLAALIRLWLDVARKALRSEEHTSELQSRENFVCRLL